MFRAIAAALSPPRSRTEHAQPEAQARARPPSEPPGEDEIAALCRSHVFAYALRRLGQAADAEDVAVETLAAALSSRHTFRGQSELRGWLLGIARRKVIDALRRRSRRHDEPTSDDDLHALPADASHDPHAIAVRAESLAQLRVLVNELPALQREALLLQVLEGLSVAEIARVLGRSESAANSLLGRARDTIRKRGAEYFGGEE